MQASTPASIAAYKEQLSTEQYLASHGQSAEAVPLTDATDTDDQFPVLFVLAGLTIPLGIVLWLVAMKSVPASTRHRRPPASVA